MKHQAAWFACSAVAALPFGGCGDDGEACPVVDRRPLDDFAFFDDPSTLAALQSAVPMRYTAVATYRGTGETTEVAVDIDVRWSAGELAVVEQNPRFSILCAPGYAAFPATYRIHTADGVLDARGTSELTFAASEASLADPDTPPPEVLSLFDELPVARAGAGYPRRVELGRVDAIGLGLSYSLERGPGGSISPVVDLGGEAIAFGPAGGRSTLTWDSSSLD
jgi:hypothetical protein